LKSLLALVFTVVVAIASPVTVHANGDDEPRQAPETQPVAVGTGGAVATVDGVATREGIKALKRGGNAVDAAVVTAAVLGVTEPYVESLGGSSYMTVYLKDEGRAVVIGDRTPAPQAFLPEDRRNLPGTGALSVGVPTTLMTWKEALDRYGTISLRQALQPAIRVAREGFVVEDDFVPGPLNRVRFRAFQSTYDLFFPNGELPVEGTLFRNPDLARAYKLIADEGVDVLYSEHGPIAQAMVDTIQHPPLTPDAEQYVVRGALLPGRMELSDLAGYQQELPPPAHVQYRGYDVYTTPPPDGGPALGEALNILEGFDLSGPDRALALHRYLEASKLAYADRERYVGDPRFVDVRLEGLLSQGYADERRCLIGDTAMQAPVAPGDPTPPYDTECSGSDPGLAAESVAHSTHHFSLVDADGNMVAYTGTLVNQCGSAVVVTGYGFCLNNELTNFTGPASSFPGDPNLAAGGKRPRGNFSPTVVVRDGQPVLTVGAAGGQTIQTTVLGILMNHFDFGMSLPEAIAAPRASQRNRATALATQSFLDAYGEELSTRFGQTFEVQVDPVTGGTEFSDAQGVAILPDGRQVAAGEPWADARVVNPEP
jgi:gamma-glutamyltranspeptidase / glutathione hydrolase